MAAAAGRSLQPFGEFGDLIAAGDLVAHDGNVVRSFNSEPDFPTGQPQNLEGNA
jgi:hypothetical protein